MAGWVPELIPILLIFHFEVIAYPVAFCVFKEWDRIRGVTTMYPEGRHSWSTLSRSLAKVSIYMLAASGWAFIYMGQSPTLIDSIFSSSIFSGFVFAGLVFLFLMFTLGFVHERMWHDSNYGLRENDTVEFKRCLVKTGTFTGLGTLTMFSALHITGLAMAPLLFIVYHIVAAILYLGLEAVWSRSSLGVKHLKELGIKLVPLAGGETIHVVCKDKFSMPIVIVKDSTFHMEWVVDGQSWDLDLKATEKKELDNEMG